MQIELDRIVPNPFNVRTVGTDDVQDLVDEIQELGFWGNFRVRRLDDHFQLIAGHRRLGALRRLGHTHAECEIVEGLSDRDMLTQSLVENLQRTGLDDVQKANGIQRLVKMGKSPREVGKLLGFSLSVINDYVLLASFEKTTQDVIAETQMPRSAARIAHALGDETFVKVAAKNKVNRDELDAISTMISDLNKRHPTLAPKIRDQLKAGKLAHVEQVRHAISKARSESLDKDKLPPDMMIYVRTWADESFPALRRRLEKVYQWRDYLDTEPELAARFRKEARLLADALKAFL